MHLCRKSWSVLALVVMLSLPPIGSGAPPEKPPAKDVPSVEEARGRARLLHEAMHGTLQVVHHEYYREDENLTIPAATMNKVFRELAARRGVQLRWLAVNADAMNADHKPQTDFEKQAAAALAAGKEEYESVAEGVYRRAGPITLTSDCLGCHAPTRTSNQDRAAGLIIAMPVKGR